MTKTIPMPAYPDKMPIDISFLFESEKPAGRHGFLQTDGSHFRFEDGTPGKFWGVNFNGGACFPSHEYSRRVARRLAMCGCNIVRFHQLDAEWNTPNIFQFAKGRRHGTRELDAESMDRLDYLICCLKAEGIYCYLDLLTYRKFKTLDGVDNAIALQDAAKPYCIFDRHLIDLQKEYATQLWRHFNPYTRLAYCDDPVFVLCEIVNETDLYSGVNCALRAEPYVTRFREGFAAWLKEKGADGDAATCDINQNSPLVTEYKMQLSQAYYREMHKHLRSLGVRIPITGTNWTRESAILKDNLCDMDFTDSHYYVYDWRWGEDEKFCTARSISESPVTGFAKPAKMRSFEKPFFLSEWDMPWPNPYRAESPIFYAAINNLQDWCGMAIHTYAYSTGLDNMKLLGKEFSSDSIGKIPYREGIFSTWNDPAKFGLFYHAALIVRRGDIAPAKTKIACNITALDKTVHGAMQLGVECNQVASCFDGIAPDADRIVDEAEEYLHPGADGIVSDTGELYRNPKKSYGIINSPRTKCAYGRLGGKGVLEMGTVSVQVENDFAVVAVSSLSDSEIGESDNMLLTAVGRVRNTGFAAEGDKTVSFGHEPIVAEVICAEITIQTERQDLCVHAINAEGLEVGMLDTHWADGRLTFRTGVHYRAVYYLIQAE